MIDIYQIEDTIKEIERKDPLSLFDCQNLASLYTVKDFYLKNSNFGNSFNNSENSVQTELNDILPQYKNYCDVKRQYQMGQVSEKAVIQSMDYVCREIKQFLKVLYSSTDTPVEREKIKQMIIDLQGTFK